MAFIDLTRSKGWQILMANADGRLDHMDRVRSKDPIDTEKNINYRERFISLSQYYLWKDGGEAGAWFEGYRQGAREIMEMVPKWLELYTKAKEAAGVRFSPLVEATSKKPLEGFRTDPIPDVSAYTRARREAVEEGVTNG